MPGYREEGDRNRNHDQHDDDPFEEFHPLGRGAVSHLSIDTLQCLQFPENAGVPGFKVKPLGSQSIDAGKVLIAEEFECIELPWLLEGNEKEADCICGVPSRRMDAIPMPI